ncbi:MAG: hypothetical protein U9N34_05970 [Candidatus Cloacimonadota bacterium]|nr:hypothetical protein [Candidatus Cloacimonadota bacterium]
MKWEISLKKWRSERNLNSLQPNYLDMMSEEIQEYNDAVVSDDWHEKIDSICDQKVLTTNCIEQTLPLEPNYCRTYWEPEVTKSQLLAHYTGDDPADDLHALYRIDEILTDELIAHDVVPSLAMKQVVSHISSRKQDPTQATEWADGIRLAGEKWLKWKQQPAETIYEPNYNLCRAKQL